MISAKRQNFLILLRIVPFPGILQIGELNDDQMSRQAPFYNFTLFPVYQKPTFIRFKCSVNLLKVFDDTGVYIHLFNNGNSICRHRKKFNLLGLNFVEIKKLSWYYQGSSNRY